MKKILIIDDDIGTSRDLVEDLSQFFEVKFLDDAGKVETWLSNNIYDCIILDNMMPIPDEWTDEERTHSDDGMRTGEVLYRKIRLTKSELPILVLSARPSFRANLGDSNYQYLRKPERIDTIIKELNKLMNNED